MKKIGIIIASTREGRIGKQVAEYVLNTVIPSEAFAYELIDLREENLPFHNEPMPAATQKYQYEHTIRWSKKIKEFSGFVIVTPEYNHGYPAALKNALDTLYVEWNNKPVALVGYGYNASGSRAIEQLRQILTYVQLKPIWREVLINLGTTLKDGVIQKNDGLDNAIKAVLEDFEKAF